MERVTGIGGVFFKSEDPKKLQEWYESQLGIQRSADGSVVFEWRGIAKPEERGMTVWAPFPKSTRYFDPSSSSFMVNYRVENLDLMIEQLLAGGAQVDEKTEESEYGKFGWVMDPEGNRIELWEPPPQKAELKIEN